MLNGGAGDDWLDGELGEDQMAGGAGHDVYYVDDYGDVIVEQAGEGSDAVWSSVSIILPDHVETLNLSGEDDLDENRPADE